jgi:hypothetical protein
MGTTKRLDPTRPQPMRRRGTRGKGRRINYKEDAHNATKQTNGIATRGS